MEQARGEMQRQINQQIAELERQRDESNDTAEQERLDRRIEELRNQPDPTEMMETMMSPEVMRFSVIGGVTGLVTNLVLAVGGIGLLLMAGWGRVVSLVAAVLKIVNIVVISLINLLVFMPRQYEAVEKMMESMPTGPGGPPATIMMTFVEAWGTVWAIISIILVCIYPIVLLVLLNLKDVRRLLGGQWPEAEVPAGSGITSAFPLSGAVSGRRWSATLNAPDATLRLRTLDGQILIGRLHEA